MSDIPAFRGLTGSGQPDFQLPNTIQQGHNGRVNFFSMPSAGGAPAKAQFTYPQEPDSLASQDLMRGNWSETPVSAMFFSMENMNWVQKEIQHQVYKRSEGKWQIDPQDIDEVKIIMRAMYLQYGKNLPTGIKQQVADLNRLVVDWAVPRILSEISMYTTYMNDIDKLPVPMDRPVLMSSAGTKSKPFTHYM